MITADVQPEIRPEVTRKMRKSFEAPASLRLPAWGAADDPDVTDKNQNIKPRMNTNSHELGRQKPSARNCCSFVFTCRAVASCEGGFVVRFLNHVLTRVIRVIRGEVYFDAREATIFSKRGSPRSGS